MAASAPTQSTIPVPSAAATLSGSAKAVDHSRLKLLCIVMGPGAAVLSHALKCGTKKSPSINLLDHIASLPDSSTANYRHLYGERKRKAFNCDEKRKINSDPTCQTFDVTLLYKSITLACEDVAGLNDARWKDTSVMEGLLNQIKEERNICVHEWPQMIMDENQFRNKLRELEKLFIRTLQAIKDRYGVSATETTAIIGTITGQIQDVLLAFTDKILLGMNFDKKLNLFKEMSAGHLKDLYKHFEHFNPLPFICISNERVNIQSVFSKTILQEQRTSLEIDAFDLLKVLTDECRPSQQVHDTRPHLAVVSGIAGSGKTTLLTFMVSDWRKEECDRRVKGMENYDIVLKILSRDTDAEDLETFLGLVLPPSLSVFGEPLVKYLECCKVLFLIDGLDEMNNISEKLINNVLTISKYNKDLSVLVTSRPQQVDWFMDRYGQDYRQLRLSIKGISPARRTEFVLQYYTTSTNQDRIREFMTKQNDINLFELPLNLLFLVTFFEDNSESIKENATQASLYTQFHVWSTEKLRVRISTHPTWRDKRPLTLKTRIKRVVKEMYQIALQKLLQDKLSLSEEDVERLENCCEREDLPAQEVLGAFFTLQLSVTNRVRGKHYSLPHKGFLEYFAARHIMHRLQDGSVPQLGAVGSLLHAFNQQGMFRMLLNLFYFVAGLLVREEVPNRSKTIKEVIELVGENRSDESLLHTFNQQRTFRRHLNLFYLVADLLVREEVPNRSKIIKEVIELVGEYRSDRAERPSLVVLGSQWDLFLSLVEHTDHDESFLQAIAHYITEDPLNDRVLIKDSTLTSAAALVSRIPSPVNLVFRLHNEIVNGENFRAFTHHYCRELRLHLHYQHPSNTPTSDTVLHAIHRSRLEEFTGHLSADCLALLPRTVWALQLAVSSDEHAASVTGVLARFLLYWPCLFYLDIHVPMSMVSPAAALSPLPDIDQSYLTLSGVNKNLIKEACQLAAALQPRKGYCGIGFPGARLKAAEWDRLFHLLIAEPITVRRKYGWRQGIRIPEITITEEEQEKLSNLTRASWGCEVLRCSDDRFFLQYC